MSRATRPLRLAGAALLALLLSGCVVLTVAGAAVSVGATVVGAAVDVAVGAVKLTGKAVGSAVDAIRGGDEAEPRKTEEPQAKK
jgi:predicted anti-sigma-YlaC factor YlaD